jgi:signal transduction histidine kinase/ligand-binding sensor domain-containing protein
MQPFKKLKLSLLLLILVAHAYTQEAGRPFIRNFPPTEYRASYQNWAVTQDSRGIMYFANTDGLLEYDGINWKLIKLPNVYTISIDSHGRIYTGTANDLGYLESDKDGNYQFYSLKAKIPENQRDTTAVWYSCISGDQVIFSAPNKIFIYKNDQIKVLSYEGGFGRLINVRNRVFVRGRGKGLFCLDNDSLKFIEGSERFGSVPVNAVLPYGQNEFLIASSGLGITIYSPEGPVKFRKPGGFEEVDNFLIKNLGSFGTALSNGNYALGSVTGGIIIFHHDGKIINRYDKSNGLYDNTVYALYFDRNEQLWAGMENGISLIPVNLPFRYYTENDGLNGPLNCLAFFKNRFYAGTTQHLYIRNKQGYFEPIAGTDGNNISLIESNGTLLLAGYQSGFIEIRDNQAIPLVKGSNIEALSFCTLKKHPGYLLAVSLRNGYYLMEFIDAKWKLKHHIKGFNKTTGESVEDSEGNIWLSNTLDLSKLKINTTLDSVISCQQYTTEQGLPSNYAYPYALNSGEVVFGTEKGVYRYRADQDRFEPHPDFSMLTGKISGFQQLKNGDIWFEELSKNGNYEKGILKFTDGGYVAYKTPFYNFFDVFWYLSSYSICTAPDSTIYIAASSGLLQYDPSKKLTIDLPFNTLIRKVYSRDTLLFGGAASSRMNPYTIKGGDLPYKNNNMVFDFASTFYEDPEKTVYTYRLIGSDTIWSAWEKDHKKEYTNLREGSYTFEVRSKNQYQVIGSTASYSFNILPPWYRIWLAYLSYLVFAGLIFYVLVYYRTRNLRERSRELEKTVELRTAQIQEQKNNVEKLSLIGRDINSSLSIENIIHTVYENVNTLMDASVFTIGLHKPEENSLEFPATIEKNQLLPPFSVSLEDENRLAAWCFNNRKEVIINDYTLDHGKYIGQMTGPIAGESPESILYLPLWNKEKEIGVITAQSFSKNAYNDYHLNMLRNLATYTAIALENADAYRRLAVLLNDLKSTQTQLIQSEKMASLGELTAGIAHEIQNPLNFVNNFSDVNTELIAEMKEKIDKGTLEEAIAIANDIEANEQKINHHGKRADAIVKGMLQHSRTSSGVKVTTDINALADEYFRLAYHGLRAKDKAFNAIMKTDFDETIGNINIIPQDIGRVILNLITNAFYAVAEKKKQNGVDYDPTVSVSTKKINGKIEVSVKDNGNGIPQNVLSKIFQPFFTTKPSGQGTGLGLSLAYDIVKAHGGEIRVDTREGEGSEFIIILQVSN